MVVHRGIHGTFYGDEANLYVHLQAGMSGGEGFALGYVPIPWEHVKRLCVECGGVR